MGLPTLPAASQRVADSPTEAVLPEVVLPPIVVDADATTPAEAVVPTALVVPVENTISPWTWAAMGVVGIAGASWAVQRYWLKSKLAAARRPDDWRRDQLGLDFDLA